MSKNIARILFLAPALCLVFIAADAFWPHSTWPPEAQAYLGWYLHQPLKGIALILNTVGMVGIAGFVLSSIGVVFFWSPARYFYLASLLLSLCGEYQLLPVLVSGAPNLLSNVASIVAGTNLAIMFFSPIAQHFSSVQEQ